jgi:penicillin-binding protein 1A
MMQSGVGLRRSRRRAAAVTPAVEPVADGAEGATPTIAAGLRRQRRQRIVRRTLLTVFLLFVALITGGWYYINHLPLPNPHPQLQATVIYDASGHQIGTLGEQDRQDVTLAQVPPIVIDAVVSTEDRHYFSEGGIDPSGIARAAFSDITGHGGLQGGSTITQQYVKQAYLTPKRTLLRKVEEVAIAYRLSQVENKKEILQNYLNTIYWGRGVYGIQAASEAYFGKPVSQLGLKEAALLAGLIRDPEGADPAHDASVARRNQVDTLKALKRDHKITAAQATLVQSIPFSKYVLAPHRGAAANGTAGNAYFLDAVRAQLIQKYGRNRVYGGGLRVTTTLDPRLQALAYQSVYGSAPGLNPAHGDPSAAVVSIDDTGAVKALVGGQDFVQSSVDLALGTAGGGSGRQAGSTFKAMMLAEVIKEGYSVESVFPAPQKLVVPHGNAGGAPWIVTNYEHESVPPKDSLVDATALSINTVYAQVVARIGAGKLDQMAKSLGIAPSEIAHPYLSQVLGSANVSPLEMAAAYATFADGGQYHTPLLITRVTTGNGRPLTLPVAPKTRTVLTPSQAATMDYVLQQVVTRGTGTAAGGVGSPVAGKTGTTEFASDAWFIGYTPKLTTALWMGYADSTHTMDGFRGLASVTGGSLPAHLWHQYMAAVLAQDPQYGGSFPSGYVLGGKLLTAKPPPPTSTSTTGSTTATTGPGTTTSAPNTTLVPGPAPTNPTGPGPTTPLTAPPTTRPPPSTTTSTSTTTTTSTTVPAAP